MAKKKKWIQGAIKNPGALKAKAKAQGKSVSEYCSGLGSKASGTSKRQCSLAKTLSKVRPKKKK
jgi:hypothetical protein